MGRRRDIRPASRSPEPARAFVLTLAVGLLLGLLVGLLFGILPRAHRWWQSRGSRPARATGSYRDGGEDGREDP